jgi:hypothetical protein
MHMVKAVAAGHAIEGVSKSTNAALHNAANSMTPAQGEDFQTLERPKPRSLLRKS